MPFVNIRILEGHSQERKDEIARRVTETISEVAKLPAMVRRVFASPDALASRFGGSPERRIDISGTKNSARPAPCAKRDQAIIEKLTSVLKPANQNDARPSAQKLAVLTQRKSIRPV